MKLVEVVKGRQTNDEVAMQFLIFADKWEGAGDV